MNYIENKIINEILQEVQHKKEAIEIVNKNKETWLSTKGENEIKDLLKDNKGLEGKIKEEQEKINELEKDIKEREIEKEEIQTRFNESLDNVKYKNLEIFEIGGNNFPDEILLLDEKIQKKFNELNNKDGDGLISEQKEELKKI